MGDIVLGISPLGSLEVREVLPFHKTLMLILDGVQA
jgi:hypothetical protein